MGLPRVIPGFFSDWDHISIESFIDNKYIRNKQYTNKFPWKPNLMMKYINDPFPWWLKLTIINCNCFDNSLQKLRIKGISILNFHESLSLDYITSLSNKNYFTSAKKCRRESCIIDFTSAKMEFASAIFKKLYFSKYSS